MIGTDECIITCVSDIETKMEWTIDDVPFAEGTFGFTFYRNEKVVYKQEPYFENKSGSVTVTGEVDRIGFETNTNDGIHLLINISQNGEKQNYFCKNCLSNSPSLQLGRLYLDSDMNGPNYLNGASNCKNSCEFEKEEGNLLDFEKNRNLENIFCEIAQFLKL